ncbi:energy transducer TonB [Treponema sp.]|uniref:energy transducer TonB n=1 Tax=Treponema sp. TaxID=166 RepID=UPI00388F29A9
MKCLNENVSLSGLTGQSLNELHTFSPKRWAFCSFFTLVLVLGVLALPFWNFHVTATVSESISENAVSVVKVTQRRKVKAVKKVVEKKIQPKPENSIPAIPKEPAADSEEKIEEVETQETPDETNELTEENFSDSIQDSAQTESAGEFSENPVISEEVQKATASYKSYALSRIESKKQYPYSARSKGLEGKVRLSVIISPDGSLKEAKILKTCGHEILNEAALNAVKKSAPFKKMKGGMSAMTLIFVMDFSLK